MHTLRTWILPNSFYHLRIWPRSVVRGASHSNAFISLARYSLHVHKSEKANAEILPWLSWYTGLGIERLLSPLRSCIRVVRVEALGGAECRFRGWNTGWLGGGEDNDDDDDDAAVDDGGGGGGFDVDGAARRGVGLCATQSLATAQVRRRSFYARTRTNAYSHRRLGSNDEPSSVHCLISYRVVCVLHLVFWIPSHQ